MNSFKILMQIINYIVLAFFIILQTFAKLRTIFSPLKTKQVLPPLKSDLLRISAKKLAVKIRQREVKCADVVEAYITRIQDVNPIINAVVQHRFAEAMNEAIRVDLLVESTEDPNVLAKEKPLLGVPITVKEAVAVKDMSNNSARSRVASHIAEQDAECIASLRKAGAIPLVVSNTPELCLYLETYNPVYGRTNNPYDSRRTSAGSSGGEAALVGAGASLLSIGSDIAGSIRLPAMFCGCFGHKPTPGFVSNNGHIPSSNDPMWDQYFTIGPLTRYAEDLPLLLQHMMSGKNDSSILKLNENVDIGKINIFYMYGEGQNSTLQNEPNFQMKKAVKTAVDIMNNNYHCTTTKIDLTCFRNSFALTMFLLRMKGVENIFQPDDEHPDDYDLIKMIEMLFKKATFQTKASLSTVFYGPLNGIVRMAPEFVVENLTKRLEHIKLKLLQTIGTDGVLIYPTFSTEAFFHQSGCGQILNISYCTLFNVLGFPSTQCHIRYTREGMPVGVQIIAAPGHDHLSLAVAEAVANITGGWQPPDEVRVENQ